MMEEPQATCDIVMKGGITSGVVYPGAVVALSGRYRFRNIGGTSAGAIAAVVTAAAEYGRAKGGFAKVAKLPKDLSTTLLQKFQPTPEARPLFGLLLAAQSGGKLATLAALLRGFPLAALAGGLLAVLAFLPVALAHPGPWAPVFWSLIPLVLLAALLALIAATYAALRRASQVMADQDYGLCTGVTQPGATAPALTDWLSDVLDEVAGLSPGEGPLTIAHLGRAGIKVQTVTTDITTRRPYALPMQNNLHAFDETEFRKLFPERIVRHMIQNSAKVGDDHPTLYWLKSEALPVVVLARLSLSFPGLLSAVPLHRMDFTLTKPAFRRCVFSDGGLSSNFPVQFFDEFLPMSPTFGISLTSYDADRRGAANGRATLPDTQEGRLLPTQPFKGLSGFVMALFDSAKDWQDSLQSVLTGYRERIVSVALKTDEGGLNLQMPEELITSLGRYGTEAGQLLVAKFDLDAHRWRRFLTELPAIEALLTRFADSWDAAPDQGTAYPALVATEAEAMPYNLSKSQREILAHHAEQIAALGRALKTAGLPDPLMKALPSHKARLRLVADMAEADLKAREAPPNDG